MSSCKVLLAVPGDLPVARAAILKHVLRSMHRMMQSSGTAEGLRGLIDMSILQSIKKIIKYRGLFGPTVVPLGAFVVIYPENCLIPLYSDQHHGYVHPQRAHVFGHHPGGWLARSVLYSNRSRTGTRHRGMCPPPSFDLILTSAGHPSHSQRHRSVMSQRSWYCTTRLPSKRHSSHFLHLHLGPSSQGPSR